MKLQYRKKKENVFQNARPLLSANETATRVDQDLIRFLKIEIEDAVLYLFGRVFQIVVVVVVVCFFLQPKFLQNRSLKNITIKLLFVKTYVKYRNTIILIF